MNAGAEDDGYEDAEETYLSLDYDYALSEDISIGLNYGSQSYSDSAYTDEEDTAISISKGDMTFTVSGNEDDDTRAIISWGQSF